MKFATPLHLLLVSLPASLLSSLGPLPRHPLPRPRSGCSRSTVIASSRSAPHQEALERSQVDSFCQVRVCTSSCRCQAVASWRSRTSTPSTLAHRLQLIDLVSGVLRETGQTFQGRIAAADPRRPRLYSSDGPRIAVVDLESSGISYLAQSGGGQGKAVYTATGPVLFLARNATIDVIDLATGALLRTLQVSSQRWTVDETGMTLYAVHYPGLLAIDVVTGAVRASRDLPFNDVLYAPTGVLTYDATRQVLMFSRIGPGGPLALLDPQTLATRAEIPLTGLTGMKPAPFDNVTFRLQPSGKGDAFYLAALRSRPHGTYSFPECFQSTLSKIDAATARVVEQVDTSVAWGGVLGDLALCPGSLIAVGVPSASVLQATVTGRNVTFSWSDPGNTRHFDVEAGSASGLNNLAVSHGHTTTSLIFDNVPPGKYFVRVRAINWVGGACPRTKSRSSCRSTIRSCTTHLFPRRSRAGASSTSYSGSIGPA